MLEYGLNQRLVRAALTSATSAIAVELTQDKDGTKQMLNRNCIPIPPGVIIDELNDLSAQLMNLVSHY